MIKNLCTWFGCGSQMKGSGTVGTLGGLAFAFIISIMAGHLGLFIFAIIISGLGFWASSEYMKEVGQGDHGEIVIDEVAGIFITLCFIPFSFFGWICAFAAFRLFDIWKPFPASYFDKMKNAYGVMMDDIVAGLMAGIVLWIIF
jgi:phosphatidylglycerophosphatase A